MDSATAAARVSHLGWSRWFHCQSSFELSLVPRLPGLFAVARLENQGKQLVVTRVEASDDLFHSLSQLFGLSHPLRREFEKGGCVLRYANIPDDSSRCDALSQLQAWLAGSEPARSAVVEEFLHGHESHAFRNTSD